MEMLLRWSAQCNFCVTVLLLIIWCCRLSSTDRRLNLIQPRLVQMLKMKQRLPFRREQRSEVDLRGHKLFTSHPQMDCCPTKTVISYRRFGINQQGILLELVYDNFTQSFYETLCRPASKDRPCQFIDRNYVKYSRCVQQYSYVYAIARTYGNIHEQWRVDFIRVGTGCKCEVDMSGITRYSNRLLPNNV